MTTKGILTLNHCTITILLQYCSNRDIVNLKLTHHYLRKLLDTISIDLSNIILFEDNVPNLLKIPNPIVGVSLLYIEEIFSLNFLNSTEKLIPNLKTLSLTLEKNSVSCMDALPSFTKLTSLTLKAGVIVIPILTTLTTLRLKDCIWVSNFANLRECPNLERLYLESCSFVSNSLPLYNMPRLMTIEVIKCDRLYINTVGDSCSSLKYMKFNQCKIVDFYFPTSHLPSLEEIHIINCESLTTISGLENCTKLKILNITTTIKYNMLKTISSLSTCINLTNLKLIGIIIDDISTLIECSHLQSLEISLINPSKIFQLAPLTTLKKLKIVFVEKLNRTLINTKNNSSLSNEIKLNLNITELNLSNCDVEDIIPLLSCSLKVLTLIRINRLDNLSCPSLEELYLDTLTPVTNLLFLSDSTKLQKLIVKNYSGSSLLGLNSSYLIKLKLEKAIALIDISALIICENLLSLKVYGCIYLKDIAIINTCSELRKLTLVSSFLIYELPPLKGLTRLRKVNFSECHNLEKCSAIGDWPSLEYVNLNKCFNVKDISYLSRCVYLKTVLLQNCNITSIIALFSCQYIEELNLEDNKNLVSISTEENKDFYVKELKLEDNKDLSKLSTEENKDFSNGQLKLEDNKDFYIKQLDLKDRDLIDISSEGNKDFSTKQLKLENNNLVRKEEGPFIELTLPNLKILNFNECVLITNIDFLRKSPNLKSLSLIGCFNIEDLTPISSCTLLEEVYLIGAYSVNVEELINSLSKRWKKVNSEITPTFISLDSFNENKIKLYC
jgi:hypothetical protein